MFINTILSKTSKLSLVAGVGLFAYGCGSAPSSDDPTTNPSPGGSPAGSDDEIEGTVVLGPVNEAAISVYLLHTDGTRGDLLGTTTTDALGYYRLALDYDGAIEVVARGGHYEDEATGEEVSRESSAEIRTLVSEARGFIGVNALTTIAAARAAAQASEGLANAIAAANEALAAQFGLDDADFVRNRPDDLTRPAVVPARRDRAEARLGLIMAGFSQMAADNDLKPQELDTLIALFAEDYTDGTIDGRNGEQALESVLAVTPDQAYNGLATALNNFANSERNVANYPVDEIPELDASDE